VLPVVRAVGLVEDRAGMDSVLITRFLNYALPYRYLFREWGGGDPSDDLVRSLAGLLARLHLVGFYWGDCSLSNALFRRDATRLSAYALDTETGELHHRLTDGQRMHDIEIAVENVAGGLFDLAAAGFMPETVDPFDVVERLERPTTGCGKSSTTPRNTIRPARTRSMPGWPASSISASV
jgi:hypothetical protein